MELLFVVEVPYNLSNYLEHEGKYLYINMKQFDFKIFETIFFYIMENSQM
jgi:hypothetical protein